MVVISSRATEPSAGHADLNYHFLAPADGSARSMIVAQPVDFAYETDRVMDNAPTNR